MKILWWVAAMALLLAPVVAEGKGLKEKKGRWEAGADARKADYLFMEAQRQNALDNQGAYFELMQRVVELDTADTQPGSQLAFYYFAIGESDTVYTRRGLEMMRRHFESSPSDFNNSRNYGMVNSQIGNTREAIRVWSTLDSLYPHKPNVTLSYAQALMTSRDSANLDKAIGLLNRLERAEGKDLGLVSHKIRIYLSRNDTASVRREVGSLLESSPRNAGYSLYAGDVMMVLGQPDSAIAYYNRACDYDPSNGLTYYKRAEFYRERGDSVGFDREVFQAVKQEGLDVDVKLEIFTEYIRQLYTDTLQRERIQNLFDTLLLQHPHEAGIRDLYSSYLVAIDDYSGAAEQQEYALDADPSDQKRWRSAISLYAQAQQFDKALAVGEHALHYFPDDNVTLLYTATALQQLDRNDDAIRYLREAVEKTDDSDPEMKSTVLCALGDALYTANEPDSAFEYYGRSLEYNPGNLLALNNYAYFLAEAGKDLDKAEGMSAICVRQQPDNDTSLDTYAWIMFKKKEYAKAKEYIDRVLEIAGEDVHSDELHHAGDIYYMSGEPEAALTFWKRALEQEPDNKLLQKKVKYKTHFYE